MSVMYIVAIELLGLCILGLCALGAYALWKHLQETYGSEPTTSEGPQEITSTTV